MIIDYLMMMLVFPACRMPALLRWSWSCQLPRHASAIIALLRLRFTAPMPDDDDGIIAITLPEDADYYYAGAMPAPMRFYAEVTPAMIRHYAAIKRLAMPLPPRQITPLLHLLSLLMLLCWLWFYCRGAFHYAKPSQFPEP